MTANHPQNTTYIPSNHLQGYLIGYCTDIEGNLEYWNHYKEISRVLEDTDDGVRLKRNCYFIYGGDVCDRGPGDLRVLQDILKLKKDNPDHVHIILGNRDINKIRLLTELQPEFTCKEARAFWIGDIDDKGDLNAVNRLKAILEQTMGAPQAFEFRRQELNEMGRGDSDSDVVQSFMETLKPDGLMTEYIVHGALALILGDCLFLHGGVHSNSYGWVPPFASASADDTGHRVEDVAEWCAHLEVFRSREVSDFVEYSKSIHSAAPGEAAEVYSRCNWSSEGGYHHCTPGSRLLQYGMGWMPDNSVNPTLVYDNFLSDGAPQPPPTDVIENLTKSGVRKLVTGHQPHGDAPVVIDSGGLQVITGDTSYARNVRWFGPDATSEQRAHVDNLLRQVNGGAGLEDIVHSNSSNTRGAAVSEICIKFDDVFPFASRTFIHGMLNNGLKYDFELPASSKNRLIGKVTKDGWWVKGRMTTEGLRSASMTVGKRSTRLLNPIWNCIFCCCSTPHSQVSSETSECKDTNAQTGDDDVYLVCLSSGRDVYNSLVESGELRENIID
mmetsp:Transcript_9739/g.14687  ORF Transcript_9739/g.14687 Transcript_9739/m.14687 type:complete len:555 (+) Transcript_9739:139-1803(+)